jgi:glycosyltransferase involved in cell wall biosynthesis
MTTDHKSALRICQVLLKPYGPSETFLVQHARQLPVVSVVHGPVLAHRDGNPVLSQSIPARALRKATRLAAGRPWSWEVTSGFLKAFRDARANVVLAEYGETGVLVREACVRGGFPMVVHFHGYDASSHATLERLAEEYRALFRDASAIVAVSRPMAQRLLELGAPSAKLHHCCYGIDCTTFTGANPGQAPPLFLAVGRFVPKKAPHLTIRAFARGAADHPDARLLMVGEGDLLPSCRELVDELGIASRVSFLGRQTPAEISALHRQARAFVQHSVAAPDGDSEGTPVSILEASASGLPVISTRHAGIPEAVEEDVTGILVNEHDVNAMASAIRRLCENAPLAARLGEAGALRARTHFADVRQIARLRQILAEAAHVTS